MSSDHLAKPLVNDNALSDRLMALLRERVAEKTGNELAAYLDRILPPYDIPDSKSFTIDDRKLVFQVAEFLDYHDAEFVEVCYLCLFKRRVDTLGLEAALQALRSEGCTRIQLLGRLRYSQEGNNTGVEVRGLYSRYFFARLRKIPVLGRVVGLITNLDQLLRLDLEVLHQEAELARGRRNRDELENQILEHFEGIGSGLGVLVDDFSASDPKPLKAGDMRKIGTNSLVEIISHSSAQFVLLIYDIALNREPTETEMDVSLECLRSGKKSRISLLGDLLRTPGANRKMSDIPGLSSAYLSERLLSIPIIGFILQLPRALRMLSRIDAVLEYHSAEIADRSRELYEREVRLMEHYNNTLMQLRRELDEALRESATKLQK